MREIVFLTLLAICSAELGYQYQQNGPAFGYETESALSNSQATDHYQDHADFHKHFYAFEAPYDSSEEADLAEQKISSLSQKNLQVVFIKAPENKAVQGALNALVKQSTEDKTAIYVLNKQTDPNELASKITALQSQRKHKPQVHFVKYRTDVEAAHAQQHIQEQYGGVKDHSLQPLQPPLLGYSQQPESSQAAQGYYPSELPQQPELPPQPELPQPAYYPTKQPQAPQAYYPPELPATGYTPQPEVPQTPQGYYLSSAIPLLPTPHPSYLSPLPSSYQGYDYGRDQSNVVPLAQQQLTPGPYDLDARTARSRRIDFRVNERHRSNSRMIFPTDTPSRRYLPAQKRKRRAHF
ncbi:DNA translocase FtsK [Drosophila nasuta]|uniref:DNA translocase FtsK n=1 Tax=Drosophila nasuta TaxID=42062 RepID=UPI00295E2B53|nr:DNA translocase FtsK [Drosophila nasuta]